MVSRPADHASFLVDEFATQVRNLPESLTGKEKQQSYAHDRNVVWYTQELSDLVFIEYSFAVVAFSGGFNPCQWRKWNPACLDQPIEQRARLHIGVIGLRGRGDVLQGFNDVTVGDPRHVAGEREMPL